LPIIAVTSALLLPITVMFRVASFPF
jgi:hypothetical protein